MNNAQAQRFMQHIDMLASRWQDEYEYEAFVDYETSMKKALAQIDPKATFVRGSKRPFGAVIHSDDKEFRVVVKGRRIVMQEFLR